LDWARPEQWPDLPYLRSAHEGASGSSAGLQAEIANHGKTSSQFYITHRSESSSSNLNCPLPVLRDPVLNTGVGGKRGLASYSWVWPPCEALLFGTAYAASDIIDRKSRERCPEPFAGSLHQGVDIKATLRAAIRGEQRVQVKALSAPARMNIQTEGDDEPTVFIFEREAEVRGGHWNTLLAGGSYEMRRFVQDQRRFDEITNRNGHEFVACVQFCAEPEPAEHLKQYVSGFRYLYGITLFGNPSLNHLQSARWLESCDYTGCPIVHFGGTQDLFQYYQREHSIALDREKWVSSLIRMALPFAKRRVTVLLPKSQVIEPPVSRDAAVRRISLECLPLTHFSQERITTIRNQYLVRPLDVNTLEYPDALQAAFGEPPRKYIQLLPQRIRAQLEPPS
jgi:hypothetical protein